MNSKFWIIVLALCVSAACTKQGNDHKNQSPLRVNTMVVNTYSGNANSRYVGTIEASREIPLSLQTAGRVVSISAKNGQTVKKGQELLAVDNTQALNALKGAESAYLHAKDGYLRAKKVHEKGVVSDQKMVEIESQYTQAKSIYEAAKQQVQECTLVAPSDGVVSRLEVEKGQTIIPGTKLCSLLDVSGFSVRFTVPESEINLLPHKGIVECSAVGKTFPVSIKEKSVAGNPVTHTYDVVASIEGGKDVLKSGMVAKVTLSEESKNIAEGEIVIPAKCVLLKPEGHTVWVVEQGSAVRRTIQIGGYQANGIRVLSGLQVGDTLITDGYQKLYTGCRVQGI